MREEPMESDVRLTKQPWILTLASIAVIIAALYLAKDVLVPLTLAVLLSFLLSPICDWLERRGLARLPAVLVTALTGFVVLGLVIWTAVVQLTDLAPKLPEYQSNIEAKLHSVNDYVSGALSHATRAAQELAQFKPADGLPGSSGRPLSVRVISSPPSAMEVIGGMFGTLIGVLGAIGIVIVLVVFFLIRRDDLRDRFIRLVGGGQVTQTTRVLEDAAARVSRYLLMQLVVNSSLGALVALGLYLIGVPNAVLWGIVAAALRFIPYVGVWIAAVVPIGLSLAISDNWLAPILTIALFVILELAVSNVLEPWLYGKHTGVSPVAVLVAAVVWTWLWGIAGLLLATPMTVCLLVIGKHVPQLSFLTILLGDEPVFSVKTRVYQRLLAGDQEEAAELLEERLEVESLAQIYDTVLIPALANTEAHWLRGELNNARHAFIFQSVREIIEGLGESERVLPSPVKIEPAEETGLDAGAVVPAGSSKPYILCLPARTEADEIAGMMLTQLLRGDEWTVQPVSITAEASEIVDFVEKHEAIVICISAMAPAAVMHSRHLFKRLRRDFPAVRIVIGLWDAPGDLDKARNRIGSGKTAHVVATLAEAQKQVRQCIQPASLPIEADAQLASASTLPETAVRMK
jgi:predicted PurR-regulated permease PerM